MKKNPKRLEIQRAVSGLTSGSLLVFGDSPKRGPFLAVLPSQALRALSYFRVNLIMKEASGLEGRLWLVKSCQ